MTKHVTVALVFTLTVFISTAAVAQPGSASEPVRYVGSSWADINYHDGRLRPAVGVQSNEVMHCNRSHPELSDGFGWTYNHAPMLTYWNDKFYLEYLSNPFGEHGIPGQTLVCTSTDGINWSFPSLVFPIYNNDGDELLMHQRMGFYIAPNGRLLILGFYGIPTGEGEYPNRGNGIGRVVREIYADDSFGPIYFIRYNSHNGFGEGNTHYPLYSRSDDQGFLDACEALLANKLMTQQWWEEDRSEDGFYVVQGDGDFSCKGFNWYHRPDNVIVGMWKEGYSALTTNDGHSWTEPQRCETLSDNASKHWAQATDDGRYALLYNPRTRRFPLMVISGDDGILFDNKLTVQGDIPKRRFDGRFKDSGAQYVRGIIEGNGNPPGDDLWAVYSMNKEDIWVSRVPLPVRYAVEEQVNDNFENMAPGGVVIDWNIYSSKWAPVKVVEADGGNSLQLQDKSRYDYAKAVRVFPQTAEAVVVNLKVRPHQTDTGRFDIDVVNAQGRRPARLTFNTNGVIEAENGTSVVNVGSYQPDKWFAVRMRVDVEKKQYDLFIDGQQVLSGAGFAESVSSVERIILRTGKYRLSDERPHTPEWSDFPNADDPVPLAVFDVDDVVTTDPYAFPAGDVNQDGAVNFIDLARIFEKLLE